MHVNKAKWNGVSYLFDPKTSLQEIADVLGKGFSYDDISSVMNKS